MDYDFGATTLCRKKKSCKSLLLDYVFKFKRIIDAACVKDGREEDGPTEGMREEVVYRDTCKKLNIYFVIVKHS